MIAYVNIWLLLNFDITKIFIYSVSRTHEVQLTPTSKLKNFVSHQYNMRTAIVSICQPDVYG